jgi:hypothetical protein
LNNPTTKKNGQKIGNLCIPAAVNHQTQLHSYVRPFDMASIIIPNFIESPNSLGKKKRG